MKLKFAGRSGCRIPKKNKNKLTRYFIKRTKRQKELARRRLRATLKLRVRFLWLKHAV
jgi:hypothetical protein